MIFYFLKLLFCLKLFYFVFTVNAYAYLDPGTGNILIQIIAAVAATIAIYIGFIWYKIKLFFAKIKHKMIKKINDTKNK